MRSPTARQGLSGLAFFTAAVQTGFGPFIAVYLTEGGWSQTNIGVALSIGTATAMVTQVPSGMLVDHVHGKRGLTAAALAVRRGRFRARYERFVPLSAMRASTCGRTITR